MAVTMVINHFQLLEWSSTYGEKKSRIFLAGRTPQIREVIRGKRSVWIPSLNEFLPNRNPQIKLPTTWNLKLTHNSMVWRKKLNSTSNFERTCWNQERLRSPHLESINTSNHSTRHVHKIFFKMSWLAQVQNVDRAWLRSKHARANIIDEEAGPSLS